MHHENRAEIKASGSLPALKEFQKIWLEMVCESNNEPNPEMHQLLSYGISVARYISYIALYINSRTPPSEEENINKKELKCVISSGTSATSHHTESRAPFHGNVRYPRRIGKHAHACSHRYNGLTDERY